MAGKNLRRQYAIIGLCQGFVEMIWQQRYANQENNKTFAGARDRLIKQCDQISYILHAEGPLLSKDLLKIKARIDSLKDEHMVDGEFRPMLAISFCIDLIIEQLKYTRGAKNKEFQGLLARIREFERYFDRHKTYDSPEGMEMADAFRSASN
jgi:hypothetical protein